NSVREDLSFNLLLSSDMDETQAQELQRQIAATPFVKDVSYISEKEWETDTLFRPAVVLIIDGSVSGDRWPVIVSQKAKTP
ncbi:permease-like cell division protein FtsX, partial [Porphyromonas gingivalis]|uniref:permease-like cell division protein FtsX n=1 Tax=Porphyromonas gingivalis TaxID=837 RepID=UPI0035279688